VGGLDGDEAFAGRHTQLAPLVVETLEAFQRMLELDLTHKGPLSLRMHRL
jgi:hypothetical protein